MLFWQTSLCVCMNLQVAKSMEHKMKTRAERRNEKKKKKKKRRQRQYMPPPLPFLPSLPLWKQSSSPAVRHIWSLTASGRVGIRLKLKWDTSKACSTCKHQGSNWLSTTGRININMFPHSTPTVLECQLQTSHLNTAKNQGVETHSSFIDFISQLKWTPFLRFGREQ